MSGMKRVVGGLLAVFVVLGGAVAARAEPTIDITRGTVQPMPIAVPDFFAASPNDSQSARDIAGVIAADLERSGLFAPIDKRAFIQDPASLQQGPRYQDWRLINAQALVAGNVTSQANGQISVEFRLFDVFGEQQMTGFRFNAAAANWRRVAHKVADEIYKRITGEEGYFDSRIVYVSETGPKQARIKRLAIMDQDGENH
ncbi:MAG: Tol-Pal system protein TolB, partial [Rhodospirillaceae bacterium]|nr:Tol-Pal system protein TolB [Rhodospirillaceae bacterium]